MSYNAQAESFGRSAARECPPKVGFDVPQGWSWFDQVYSDIADATPVDAPFRRMGLVGQLPSIAHLAPRTQTEILAVVVRDMLALPPACDRLVRVRAGLYQWRLSSSGDRRDA